MTQKNDLTTQPVQATSLLKRAIQGGIIALVLISIFLFGAVDDAKPEWGKYWMIRPFIIVPLAGAMGGVFYYVMGSIRNMGGWKKIVGMVISILGYIIALWFGTILGLDGTLWD